MQWQNPSNSGSLIWSRNSLHIHLVSSVCSLRQGQYPPVLFSPSLTVSAISLLGFTEIFMFSSSLDGAGFFSSHISCRSAPRFFKPAFQVFIITKPPPEINPVINRIFLSYPPRDYGKILCRSCVLSDFDFSHYRILCFFMCFFSFSFFT